MILAECGECGASHKLADDSAGRRFRCNHCRAAVTVPGRRAGTRTKSRSQSSPRRKSRPPRRESMSEDFEDDGDDQDFDRSPRRRSRRRQTRGPSRSSDSVFNSYADNPAYWLGLPFGLALCVSLLAWLSPAAGWIVGIGVIVICGIIATVSGLHILVQAFQESAVCGFMMLFVPFYALFYLVTRWDKQRVPFTVNLSMAASFCLTLIGLVVVLN